MKLPLVSFLMPVYNGGKTVARAIESMLNQTYENLEIVIVDDGSSDDTYSVCCEYAKNDKRLCVIQNEVNLGVAKSLNKGLLLCEGKYIARMDADDINDIERIKKQVEYMESHSNVGVLGTNINIVDELNGNIFNPIYPKCDQSIRCSLLFSATYSHPTIMLRTDVLKENNLFYPERLVEDYGLWVDLANITEFATHPEILLNYYTTYDNVTSSNFVALRKDSADISKIAINSLLEMDVSNYSDLYFGWRDLDSAPYDICKYLLESSRLLVEMNRTNERLGKFDSAILNETLIKEWRITKNINSMNILGSDYTLFSEMDYKNAIDKYSNLRGAKVIIYSTGKATSDALFRLNIDFPFDIVGYVDSDKAKHGVIFEGKEILPPERISELTYDYILIGSSLYFDEIKEFLITDLEIHESKLIDIAIAYDIVFHERRTQFINRLDCALKQDKQIAYLFCSPDYGNLGDHAIAEGVHCFFAENNYEVIEISLKSHTKYSEIVRHYIRKEDLILITGGGFLGSLWLGSERTARNIISEYPDNKIVILPQTVYWAEDVSAKRELALTQKVYANHKDLTLFARDKITFEQAEKQYPNTRIKLAPDMALFSNWENFYSTNSVRKGALLCLKFDKESVLSAEQKLYLSDISEKLGLQVRYRSTDSLKPIWFNARIDLLKDLIQDFRNAELVITDRLHGFIFAAVTGTPCVVLNAYSHKNRATFDWVKHLPYMRFAENLDCVETLAQEVLEVGAGVYDNMSLKVHYDEVIKDVGLMSYD